jgi:hypothetical protein
VAAAEGAAESTAQASHVRQLSYAQLTAVGKAALDVAYLGDNVFIQREQADAIVRIAEQLRDAQIEFRVRVRRVTEQEVFVEVPSAWPARVVLQHDEPPWFGNLRSRTYCSAPSARLQEFYALPVGLRIGPEIDFELAKQLRHGDLLRVRGRIDAALARPGSTFFPPLLVVLDDWNVAGG